MDNGAISIDPAVLQVDGQVAIVVRCGMKKVSRASLAAALAGLPNEATLVVFAGPDTPEDAIVALVRHGAPAATGRVVTDALKRVADGRLTSTVERSTVYWAAVPMVVGRAQLEQRLEECDPGAIPLVALLDSDVSVTLVDGSGNAIGSE